MFVFGHGYIIVYYLSSILIVIRIEMEVQVKVKVVPFFCFVFSRQDDSTYA